jgi:hypothetical protein
VCLAIVCICCPQIIRQSLLADDTSSSAAGSATAAAAAAATTTGQGAGPQQQQQQQQQQEQEMPDALSVYSGGPVFLVTDIQSTGEAKSNIATMTNAPFLYGVSIGICMSSATSEPGGCGLGTVGWHEVRVG